MNKEEIMKSKMYKAASVALANGFMRSYDVSAMGHYMFIEGYKFGKTGKMPTSDLDKITDNAKKK
jgi:hypothetical protein